MRKSKGKWTASYKDTFSLDHTLSPIIYAGLKRFHSVLEQKNREGGCLGVPSEYCAHPDVDVTDQEVQDWLDDIKKMMYAFENKEPDVEAYDFKMFEVKESGDGYSLGCTNLEEKARYYADMKIHEEKVNDGLGLFGKLYQNLWW